MFVFRATGSSTAPHPQAWGFTKRSHAWRGKFAARADQRTLFVSATHGSDFLCIDVATELEMPVHIILPKPVIESAPGKISLTEGFAGDFLYEQGNFLKREWNKALAFVRKAQSCADDWTYRIVNGSLIDPECYYDAGVKVIEAADVFLAVWDRQSARGLGDTAEMVEHAEKLQLPTKICDPQSGLLEKLRCAGFSPANVEGQRLIESLQLAPISSCRQQMPEF